MKKPVMLIPAPVGRITRTEPATMSKTNITMSFIERTLMNSFCILFII